MLSAVTSRRLSRGRRGSMHSAVTSQRLSRGRRGSMHSAVTSQRLSRGKRDWMLSVVSGWRLGRGRGRGRWRLSLLRVRGLRGGRRGWMPSAATSRRLSRGKRSWMLSVASDLRPRSAPEPSRGGRGTIRNVRSGTTRSGGPVTSRRNSPRASSMTWPMTANVDWTPARTRARGRPSIAVSVEVAARRPGKIQGDHDRRIRDGVTALVRDGVRVRRRSGPVSTPDVGQTGRKSHDRNGLRRSVPSVRPRGASGRPRLSPPIRRRLRNPSC
jgi:hypothetical protein